MRALLILISVLLVGCDNEQVDKLIEQNPFKKDEVISLYLDCVEDDKDALYPIKTTFGLNINLDDETGTIYQDWFETTTELTKITEMYFQFGERTYVNRVSKRVVTGAILWSCTERQRL